MGKAKRIKVKQSILFTKTKKDISSDEISKNAQLLMRAGFIYKEMAGVYDLLSLGLRVMNKINGIIREEINQIGGQEIFMSSLQDKTIWEKTNRWSDQIVDNWFKTKLKNKSELGLGFTHEEPLARLMKNYISSYKDLPLYIYQIQTKFRNEKRAKSGIMRAREFLMKDLYSFTSSREELDLFYEKAKQAYINIFQKCGIGKITYLTFASGGTFSKYSHEFQTISDAGEDIIYLDENRKLAVNKEVMTDEVLDDIGLNRKNLVEKKSIEVGNIFKQQARFSEPLELNFIDKDGQKKPVIMGAYGIGPGRLMGTVVEVRNDDQGIIWPKEITPYQIHLLEIFSKNKAVTAKAEEIYNTLQENGIEVLYDDRREIRAGEKFYDADLIGIPIQLILGEKNLNLGKCEIKYRDTREIVVIGIKDLLKVVQEFYQD